MKNLMETIRAMGVNTPRPGTDDTTVPTVKGDMPAGEVTPNPAADYQAVKNKMAQVKTKIIDDEYNYGEEDMSQDKVSASFLEAINKVKANAAELSEKKHKKAKPDFLDLDKDGNKKESMKKADADCKMEEVEQVDEVLDTTAKRNDYRTKANASLDSSVKSGDKATAKKRDKGLDMAYDKTIKAIKKSRMAKEEVEIEEAATMVLRKGGATKRMRYNPRTIEKMKAQGWVVVAEDFLEKVKSLFSIEEDISIEDAIALVEEEQAKRGRGRPKKAVDPNAAPKPTWKPGGRGRPPKNKDTVGKVSTTDTKAAAPAAKEPEKADAGDTEHVLVQLRKAANNERGEHDSGTNTIKYTNNTTGQISAAQARKALTAHDSLKTAGDRFKAQRRMGGSHAGMLAHIAGKADTTAAKPKVSLAQPGWNKK